jgi:hypothetical protein
MKVEARFGGKAKYYGATVEAAKGDGTYELRYDDGDSEKAVKEELIKAVVATGIAQIRAAAVDGLNLALATTFSPEGVTLERKATVLASTRAFDVGATLTTAALPVVDDGVDLYGAGDTHCDLDNLDEDVLRPRAEVAQAGDPPASEAETEASAPAKFTQAEAADPAEDLRQATAARLARRAAKLQGLSEGALAAKAAALSTSGQLTRSAEGTTFLEAGNDSDGSGGGSGGGAKRKSYFRPPGEGEGAAVAAAAHARASWAALSPTLPRRAAVRDLLPPVFLAALDGNASEW